MSSFLRRWRWHIGFWVVYFIGWTWLAAASYHEPVWIALLVTTAWFIGQATLVYLIIYSWVPKFLKPRRVGHFLLRVLAGLILSAAFISVCANTLIKLTVSSYQYSWFALFGYTLLGNIYWAFLAFAFTIIRDRLRNDRRNQRMEEERTKSELRFLKSQMNPHFLFNALNSIYVLIKKDPDLAEHTLAGFSEMLRYQLYECAVDHIPFEKEAAYVENYVRLEKLRKGDALQILYRKDVGILPFSIAPLLIIPLVENAFKYVSSFGDRENRVSIMMTCENREFALTVTNTVVPGENGYGPRNGAASGIGLENLRKRLALLYPDRHALDIKAGIDLFEANLKVQV